MPVFLDNANSSRDLRVLPTFATPLPRLSAPPKASNDSGDPTERYEVVIVGAGPAGLFLTLLLARYGIRDNRLLCLDSKPGTLRSGQADGLQPRTLEVLKGLGIAEEVLTEGCQMWEVAFWNPDSRGNIERTSHVPDVAVPARFPHEVTIHQGRIERILADDLARYSQRGVDYSSKVVSVSLDEKADPEYPVLVEIEKIRDSQKGDPPAAAAKSRHRVRAKHLVGCDGAHSVVRRSMGLDLVGDSRDHIWGVVDLVVDTDFPDIRRRCAIHSNAGSVMVIPRERIATGDYLTRLYVQVNIEVPADEISGGDILDPATIDADKEARRKARERRAKITLEGLLQQAQAVFKPYRVKLKDGAEIDWWAAYQIGQRMTERFLQKSSDGVPRLFIAGDACHTHSPKAGQGMNVSMMDSFNLSWKLAYHLNDLVPAGSQGTNGSIKLLNSYEDERREIARELIEFDHKFSSMFSGQIGAEGEEEGLTHEQFVEVFSTGNGFTSGCGIEYPDSDLVLKESANSPVHGTDFLSGVLRPGRRLLNVRVIRHADGNPRDLQDDFLFTGRFRLLVLTSTDLLDMHGRSASALDAIDHIMELYGEDLIELVVLHPIGTNTRDISWEALPRAIKKYAEMSFHSAWDAEAPVGKEHVCRGVYKAEDAYAIFGVSKDQGAICVVRPDGYVGALASLEDVERAERYLTTWLQPRGRLYR